MSSKDRLDKTLVGRGLVTTRSQAESYIKLGKVQVNNQTINKAGYLVEDDDKIIVTQDEQYVSRAGLKLASVASKMSLDVKDKVILDVGSSTGGFSDYVLKHGAARVVAVDIGTNQMHPALRADKRIELHEQTDIRAFASKEQFDLVLIDVSFISLRDILPAVAQLINKDTQIVAMVKPQFEAGAKDVHKGVIKNDKIRRQILKEFESWARQQFVTLDKADSQVAGAKGNLERFYLLKKSS